LKNFVEAYILTHIAFRGVVYYNFGNINAPIEAQKAIPSAYWINAYKFFRYSKYLIALGWIVGYNYNSKLFIE